MSIDYEKLTDEILQGMEKNSSETSELTKNIIKLEIGDTVLCRLVPYKPDPKNTIFHYFHHGWKTSSGLYVSYMCPSTYGEKCPICRQSIVLYKSNNPENIERSKKLRRKENWLVNIFVIDDSKNPEDNNKNRVFRFGRQIKEIIDDALTGDDKLIYGPKIFRLDEKGFDLRISCRANSDKKDAWPSYTSSKFLPESKLNLTDDEINEILDGAFDLTKIFDKTYSYEELSIHLQKHFIDDILQDSGDVEAMRLTRTKPSNPDTNDFSQAEQSSPSDSPTESKPIPPPKSEIKKEEEKDEIDNLLEELF